jgi:protein ImuB
MSAAPRTLVLVCPDWPVTVTGERNGVPVAVIEHGRILAASPAARRAGVVPGQRRREAQARCPALLVKVRDLATELRSFEPLVTALQSFGAPVTVRRAGWAGFRTRGPARYFGGEEALVNAVGAAVGVLPVLSSAGSDAFAVGVASGAFAATLAAHAGRVVPAGETAEFLAPFPVEALSRPELASLLRRLGVSTLGAFSELEEASVLARFGRDGAHAHHLARGLEEHPLAVRPRAFDHIVEAELDPPAEQVEGALFIVRGLAETLASRLAAAGLACAVLGVEMETTMGERHARSWSHDGPFSSPLVVERVRWQLESWLAADPPVEQEGSEEQRGIARLRLLAEELVADRGREDRLWGRSRAGSERVTRVLARVQGMLGPEGVLQASLVGGRGPGERVVQVPFGDALPPGKADADLPWPGRLPAPNPTILPDERVPVQLLDAAGEPVLVDGRGAPSAAPVTVVLDGTPARVASWTGPWPVDEQWWEHAGRRRRARFQVLLVSGEAYLIALEKGTCFLEGRYD